MQIRVSLNLTKSFCQQEAKLLISFSFFFPGNAIQTAETNTILITTEDPRYNDTVCY